MKKKPYESVGRWVSTVHRYGYMHLSRIFDDYQLGQGQVKYLMVLFEGDERTQDQIAHVLNMDKATTARAVRKLEDHGYVTRRPHETDRRSHLVCLTEKARELEPVIRQILDGWTATLTEGFTEEERELSIQLLKRMAENAIRTIEREEVRKT